MSDVVFLDTETTGLDPDRHPIWEVALIDPGTGREHVWQFPVDEISADPFALNIGGWWDRRWPVGDDLGPAYSVYNADAADGRQAVPPDLMAEWCSHFRDLVGTAHLCGAVVSFDEERLRRLLRANGVLPRWHYHLIDVEALAAGWAAGRAHGYSVGRPDEDDTCRWTMHNTEHGPERRCKTHARGHGTVPTPDVAIPPWGSEKLSRLVGIEPRKFDRHTALGDARWAKAIYEAVLAE